MKQQHKEKQDKRKGEENQSAREGNRSTIVPSTARTPIPARRRPQETKTPT